MLVSVGACAGDDEPAPVDDVLEPGAAAAIKGRNPRNGVYTQPVQVQLVDTAFVPAIAGQDGWNYQLNAEADLNGDGEPELIVLTARVERARGRLAWDDGQPWQVYIEGRDGRRTYVYSRRLQLGTLSMRITNGTEGASPAVVLLEQTPDQLNVYEASYSAPGRVSTMMHFQRDLDPRGELASPRLPD